jgi:chromopyrrolic acid synthase
LSIFDLPRLHFSGTAVTKLPTGPGKGLVDLSTNTALTDGGPFPAERPASDYHEYLENRGPRFDASGRVVPDGIFSASKGWNFGGNGHFWIDARIVSTEGPEGVDLQDPAVGRSVDMWGHHNAYLGTTFNRARIFDCDPASRWTTAVMVGQFCFGREGRSHENGYMFVGDVVGTQPPRWHNFDYIREVGGHYLEQEFRRSTVYQFVVREEAGLAWLAETSVSPAVTALRDAVESHEAAGVVVQFALSNMATPTAPDEPNSWDVRGSIAPWREHEFTTYPAGRLLAPRGTDHRGRTAPLHNLTVTVTDGGAVLNMITAVPVSRRTTVPGPGPTHLLGPVRCAGELELRTVRTDRLVARVPRRAYTAEALALTSGIVTVPLAAPYETLRHDVGEQGLCLKGTGPHGDHAVLLDEEEINIQVDDACLFLEHPDPRQGVDHAVEVLIRSFVRGVPAPVDAVHVRQVFNPRALPLDRTATAPGARCADLDIVRFRPGRLTGTGSCTTACVIPTDERGQGWFTVRGARAGTARVLLSADPGNLPCDLDLPGSARTAYDNDDALGFWAAAGSLAVRVLPDDWHLDDIDADDVTYDLVYREVFAYYELCFSFMGQEVFSLADRCKVETYARLIWQMSDPRNRAKTYYMPPTRDMSEPKARLLLKYLRRQQRAVHPPAPVSAPNRARTAITTRTGLCAALRHAATIELAVMMQYIYAAYSLPVRGTGQEYVQRGLWTPEQLTLVCGDGTEGLDQGIRGLLLQVAKEEMIHFLAVNNIILAIGEPFHVPTVDFADINHRLPIPVDLALEPFGVGSLQRFIAIEQPDRLTCGLSPDHTGDHAGPDATYAYSSLSELYGAIRGAIAAISDLFMVDKGHGGPEHHLFLRESVNAAHPDYQLEVDDVASALFAIDLITEQGEGNVLPPSAKPAGRSHFEAFRHMHDVLVREQFQQSQEDQKLWSPAYPVMRNPTLSKIDGTKELVTNPDARTVMQLFNHSYFLMLQLMIQHFGGSPEASLRRSKLMNASIDVMTGMMRPLGELLVTMPSGRRGKTAGPSFELDAAPGYVARPYVAFRSIALGLEHLAACARKCAAVPNSVPELMAYYAEYFRATDPCHP